MKNKQIIFTFFFLVFTAFFNLSLRTSAPKAAAPDETIKWYTFQEAVELNKTNPKKIFIDVYTDWCGWCKKMDVTTFKDKKITALMNRHFYAVKLDAEMRDSVKFQDHVFKNPNPAGGRGATHELAAALLNGQMSYPTVIFLDEKFAMITPVQGYQTVDGLEPILAFIGDNSYINTKWEDYIKTYKSSPGN